MDINFNELGQKFAGLAIEYAPKLALAVITLVIGMIIVKGIIKGINYAMQKAKLDETLRKFISNLLYRILQVAVLISVATMIGIETTSFVAVLGAMGLAVGLALQGSLQNFAGGVLIILFKPFKVGDVIEAQGFLAAVHEIQIFNTILKTLDNKTIILPNGALSNGSVVNFSMEKNRRVDFVFGIGYNDDIDKAKSAIRQVFEADQRVLKDPALFVEVSELADSSVNFTVRAWCDSAHYWDVYFAMFEAIKKRFDADGISIPYPQQDVHLHQN